MSKRNVIDWHNLYLKLKMQYRFETGFRHAYQERVRRQDKIIEKLEKENKRLLSIAECTYRLIGMAQDYES